MKHFVSMLYYSAPAAGCEPEPITSAGIELQSGCSTHVASIPAAQPSSLPHVQAMDLSLTDDVEDVIDALVATDGMSGFALYS